MIKRVRDEKGGFTLAELLIVVAIILVLVAIAIPVFTGALNNANDAVKKADVRAVKAAAATQILLDNDTDALTNGAWTATATVDGQGNVGPISVASGTNGTEGAVPVEGGAGGYVVTAHIDSSDVSSPSEG